jgi:predicted XRE-type DNA-binding protein
MTEDLDLIRGSGNAFRDFDHTQADGEQLKAILAAEIVNVLNTRDISTRKAEELTGIAAADFSRIRRAKLDRFTIDRLISILNRFGQSVDISVRVHAQAVAVSQTAA